MRWTAPLDQTFGLESRKRRESRITSGVKKNQVYAHVMYPESARVNDSGFEPYAALPTATCVAKKTATNVQQAKMIRALRSRGMATS
jgi:hypothetical protein